MNLPGKRVLLGISGGIAAYKTPEIIRGLRKMGAEIKAVMTESALQFITPLTIGTVCGSEVYSSLFSDPRSWQPGHIALAEWPDLILIAPATANLIGKIANGLADDLLSATVMASRAPVLLAPAMNENMYLNPAVKENLDKLVKRGFHFSGPARGELASGKTGLGRMEEPPVILDEALNLLSSKDFAGVKFLITAGPTQEPLDPVRYLSNHSSGKMGYALAEMAARRGGEVALVSGPTSLKSPRVKEFLHVTTAREMAHEAEERFADCHIAICCAAVADYRPEEPAGEKIKKVGSSLTLQLTLNPDILKTLGERKTGQFLAGFAAESQDLIANGLKKLKEKNLDLLIANDITLPGSGFNSDFNQAVFLYPQGNPEELPRMNKSELAGLILDRIKILRYGEK